MSGERKTQPIDYVRDVRDKLQHIEDAIYGNGREGMIARMARIEENLEASSALLKANAAQVIELGSASARLEKSVEIHHGKDHLSDLMRKKGFWAIIIMGFIILHFVSTYFPDLLNFILTLVGLPRLPAP